MRVIARLDIKNEFVIKGIHLEGLRKVGDPNELARRYYQTGIDEIIFMDAVASLYDRNNVFHIVEAASREVFIPITIGGGIRSLQDMEKALESGADKVALNTGAVRNPKLIQEAAYRFGSQAIVASIEAKRQGSQWLAYMDNGREPTKKSVLEWAQEMESLGAGELLITSVDQEGTKKGFDIELIKIINQTLSIPVIASGGLGNANDICRLLQEVRPSAVAAASVLHYNNMDIAAIKAAVVATGVKVREAA